MRRRWTIMLALAMSACTSHPASAPSASPSSPPSSSPSASARGTPGARAQLGDWPVYGQNAARTGVSPDQQPLGNVRRAWSSARLDGDVYAQPLIVAGRVFVAKENDSIYALNAVDGTQVWRAHLGEPVDGSSLPCGNIDPSGITGTPAIDVASNTMYVVAYIRSGPHHELFALDISNGNTRWHRSIDPAGLSARVEQERGALALSNGRVYVPYGGLQGDCGPYKGAVVSSTTNGHGALQQYVVPTAREGGIWTPPGPSVDAHGDLWVTTGNSASTGGFDYGNAVLHLSRALRVVDYFAPRDWASLNASDTDLGSVGPLLLGNDRAFAAGKAGIAYLLRASHLGHIGGELDANHVCSRAFGAAATRGSIVLLPCEDSLVALRASTLRVLWRISGGAGPPIIAGGAVWCLQRDGRLIVASPDTGEILESFELGAPVSRFVTLSAAAGRAFVPAGRTLVAYRLR